MSELLECSPPVSAINAQAYTVSEIDAHPDRDRIWATIRLLRRDISELRNEVDRMIEAARSEGYDEGLKDGEEEGHDEAMRDATRGILSIIASSKDNEAAIAAIKEWVKK